MKGLLIRSDSHLSKIFLEELSHKVEVLLGHLPELRRHLLVREAKDDHVQPAEKSLEILHAAINHSVKYSIQRWIGIEMKHIKGFPDNNLST